MIIAVSFAKKERPREPAASCSLGAAGSVCPRLSVQVRAGRQTPAKK
jgi:hypothetical protein